MITFLVILFILDSLLVGWLAWTGRRKAPIKNPFQPKMSEIPVFIEHPKCVSCDKKIGEYPVETHAYIKVGNRDLPVTMQTCRGCVEVA